MNDWDKDSKILVNNDDASERKQQERQDGLLYEEQQLQHHLLAVYEKNSETDKSVYCDVATTNSSISSCSEGAASKPKEPDACRIKPMKIWRAPSFRRNKRLGTRVVCDTRKPNCDKKSSLDSIEQFYCVYITSVDDPRVATVPKLERALSPLVRNRMRLKQTSCGILAIFTDKNDFDKVLKLDMKAIFGAPIQVGNLSNNEKRYRNYVTFKSIPWCISTNELSQALKQQGIHFGKIVRVKNVVRVEVFNSCHLDRLLQEGLNFYNCKSFGAATDGLGDNYYAQDIIQCYKCQGFWHTANHCRHSARCVRCGENHEVDFCQRPKSSATCCNCGGPHHAAYKNCPIKLQLLNSAKIAFSLTNRPKAALFAN